MQHHADLYSFIEVILNIAQLIDRTINVLISL